MLAMGNIADVLKDIFATSDVSVMYFVRTSDDLDEAGYASSTKAAQLRSALLSTKILKAAAEKCRLQSIPYGDALLSLPIAADRIALSEIAYANHHNQLKDAGKLTSLDEPLDSISKLELKFKNRMIGVKSLIKTKGGLNAHLPMIDFHCPVTSSNTQNVREIIKQLNLAGYLINSGKSYHFIGRHHIDLCEMGKFLGRALLFTPFVDRAWVAHQLIQSYCVLRVSAQPKYDHPPRLIAQIG